MDNNHYSLVIVGGGAAGISVANNMRRQNKNISIAIIEPSDKHYYQPGFTLVGAGVFTLDQTLKKESDLIPSSLKWIQDYAETFQPDDNRVTLRSGEIITYDFLVVCPGLQLDWDKIEGLKETLGQNNVCSNYSPETVEYTLECINNTTEGTILFTQPLMPIKCAGAPQKIMYMAADMFRKKGISNKITINYYNANPSIFSVPFFARELMKIVDLYNIKAHFQYNLIAIDGAAKKATFEITDSDGSKQLITKEFKMIHVTPPQSSPDFIKRSPLANPSGWIDVHNGTLQHKKYPNIFGLGDAASTPNTKTAAAVRKQVPVVVSNILNIINGLPPVEGYTGYGSCPIPTSMSALMLAEFSYDGKITPSFPFLDPRKSRFMWWVFTKFALPILYWNVMLKGHRIDLPSKESYAKRFLESE